MTATVRRVAPAAARFFLSPLVAEYLLGTVSLEMIAGVLVLAPMYGGGAVIIREVARRWGRGWPTILLLGAAYGLLEAGLLDQSLFNPSYAGNDFQSPAHVPGAGISAYYLVAFVVGHAVWSISIPIALVETFVPDRRTNPWLGNVGLIVAVVVFALGSALIFHDHQVVEQFLASPGQLIGASLGVVGLIALAFAAGRRRHTKVDGDPQRPMVVGGIAFAISSLYILVPLGWIGVALALLLISIMVALVDRWSRRAGWTDAHRLALAGGALLTYAWIGFILDPIMGEAGTLDVIGNAVFAIAAIGLLVVAGRHAGHRPATSPSDPIAQYSGSASGRGSVL